MLNSPTVLVLNRHWQAIHVKTPAEAFCMLATGAATALDVQADDHITPVRWDDWLKLPVREHDNAVNTPRGSVRVPTVIVAANYANGEKGVSLQWRSIKRRICGGYFGRPLLLRDGETRIWGRGRVRYW